MLKDSFVTSNSNELPNGSSQQGHYRKLILQQNDILLCLYYFLLKKLFLTETLMPDINSDAPRGGKRKPKHFTYFPWPPLETGLTISTFPLLFTNSRKILYFIYKLLMIR